MLVGQTLTTLAPVASPSRPSLSSRDITDITATTVADPFLLRIGSIWHLFVEVWNVAVQRGEIAHATSVNGIDWQYDGVVLREPFHLSYPQVFESGGSVHMVPETRQDDAVHLYVADDFPRGWRRMATLLRGRFSDATLLHRDDRWWMFAQRGLDEMRLFSSPWLERGWTEHPMSPLWPGNRSRTRPGGRMLEDEGRLLRFAQDGWPKYGHSLRAFDVTELSQNGYAEREIDASPILTASRSGWNAAGMHHIDALRDASGRWIALVDGAALVAT